MPIWWPARPAAPDPRCGHTVGPVRHASPRHVSAVTRARVALLAATVLLLAACGPGECPPCLSTVVVGIVGAGTDPARVLQVCVDGAPSCHQARIDPTTEPSKSPDGWWDYRCGGTTDPMTCF